MTCRPSTNGVHVSTPDTIVIRTTPLRAKLIARLLGEEAIFAGAWAGVPGEANAESAARAAILRDEIRAARRDVMEGVEG